MRYLVLTDIHGNLEGLEACLADARARGYDRTLVLGDLVGYGPNPNEVIDCVLALQPAAIVRGNHDKVAISLEEAEGFNVSARRAAEWTYNALTPAHRQWLADLPCGPKAVDELIEICHGSPYDEDAYIFDGHDGLRAIRMATRPLCLYGHTHQPAMFELAGDVFDSDTPTGGAETRVTLREGVKYLINPGSVGQPRDGDARAVYAVVDTASRHVDLLRIAYPLAVTQAKILDAGLPDVLAKRLALGR